MHRATLLVVGVLLLSGVPAHAETIQLGEPVVMRAAAVSDSSQGFVGSTATITITTAANGSGRIFLDTFPLTEVDMQGSARLAARVASQLTGKDIHTHDYFYVIRSGSEQIGGPSAGATMTVGTIAALNGWHVRDDVLMTGMINPDATVGPVGGIAEKATAASKVGVTRFLFPAGQEVVPLSEASGGNSQLINLTQYCSDTLHIECIPVARVADAVGLMSDHAFDVPPITANVTGAAFLAKLGPLSQELVNGAQKVYDDATTQLAKLPDGAAKTSLQERLDGAGQLLSRARNETTNETYYTAASTSFQSSIESHYVGEAAKYTGAAAQDRPAALQHTIDAARDEVQSVGREINGSPVEDTGTFESVGAAQVRIMEAESRLANAETLAAAPRSQGDIQAAIYNASYASERARTAEWWLKLSTTLPSGQPVDSQTMQDFAHDTITTSTEEVAYVEAVFAGAGAKGATLGVSRSLLDDANNEVARGYYAGAMLSAMEASVRASVLLEIAGYGGDVPTEKFQVARDNAAAAIEGARARGVESILAQSSYEFGLSLQDPVEKQSFLGLASVEANIAGLPGLFNGGATPASHFQVNEPPLRIDIVYVAAAFAVGMALGAGAGLTAMMPRRNEDLRAPPPPPPAEPVWHVPPAGPGPGPGHGQGGHGTGAEGVGGEAGPLTSPGPAEPPGPGPGPGPGP